MGFKVLDKSIVYHSLNGLVGFVESLSGLSIGMTIALLHSEGKLPEIQILLKIFNRTEREDLRKYFKIW